MQINIKIIYILFLYLIIYIMKLLILDCELIFFILFFIIFVYN